MKINKDYLKVINEETEGYRANWLPNKPIELGQIGYLENGVFTVMSSLKDHGIQIITKTNDSKSDHKITSKKGVKISSKSKGKPSGMAGGLLGESEAGLIVELEHENAFVFHALNTKLTLIENKVDIEELFKRKAGIDRTWKKYVVITEIIEAESFTFLNTHEKNNTIEIKASTELKPANINFADIKLQLSIVSEKSSTNSFISQEAVIPLYKVMGLESSFLGLGNTQLKPKSYTPDSLIEIPFGTEDGPHENKNIYPLLIGITDYPQDRLEYCLKDVDKIKTYLEKLNTDTVVVRNPKILLNEEATKKEIANEIEKIIEEMNSNDILFFYFSGHGAQEISEDRFKEDYDGLIEGVVCWDYDLLSDKELKFLFSRKKQDSTQVIGVFDTCHSGGILRGNQTRVKKLNGHYPKRDYTNFLFHKEISELNLKNKSFGELVKSANILSLSASRREQSAFEIYKIGGVFTDALIQTLDDSGNRINYSDLIRQIDGRIRYRENIVQIPTLDISENSSVNAMNSWLSLNGEQIKQQPAIIRFDEHGGWLLNKGAIDGVVNGTSLHTNDGVEILVETANLTESVIKESTRLDKSSNYQVSFLREIRRPKIVINNHDDNRELEEKLAELLINNESVEFNEIENKDTIGLDMDEEPHKLEIGETVIQPSDSDFELNIFNETVYFSFSGWSFSPIHRQINLQTFNEVTNQTAFLDIDDVVDSVENYLEFVTNWFNYSHWSIDDISIKVPIEIKIEGQSENILNGRSDFRDCKRGAFGLQELVCTIKVTNTSSQTLWIGGYSIYLSRLEITTTDFGPETKKLEPGMTFAIESSVVIDPFMEIYNYPYEEVKFKFIVSGQSEDFFASLSPICQRSSEEPRTHLGTFAGPSGSSGYPKRFKYATYDTTLRLYNSSYNLIPVSVLSNKEYYEQETIFPFIERLYGISEIKGLFFETTVKYSSNPNEARARGIKIFAGNVIDTIRRRRKFERLKIKFADKPIIVAEGDSWFLFPILLKDILDCLMEKYPVKSLAWAGDTIQNYKKSGQLLNEVEKEKAPIVLISGGGNDIIGPQIAHILKSGIENPASIEDYLNSHYKPQMDGLRELYEYFLEDLENKEYVKLVLIHGYDYIRMDHSEKTIKNGWVAKYMIEKGINSPDERWKLICFLLDEFNKTLEGFANDKRFKKVRYVNNLGMVQKGEWYDEIHPNNEGFKKIAKNFEKLIELI